MTPSHEELREAAEAATVGPWRAECLHSCNPNNDPEFGEQSGLGWDVVGPPDPMLRGMFSSGYDAHFIALARNAVPALLARIDELTAALDDYGTHRPTCAVWREEHPPCDCGLSAAMEGRCSE